MNEDQGENTTLPRLVVGEVRWDLEIRVRTFRHTQLVLAGVPDQCLYVPGCLRRQVLKWGHASWLAYHPGVSQTLAMTAFTCDYFGNTKMPSLFKEGDIMLGGIFPVYFKEVINISTYETKPPDSVVCEGSALQAALALASGLEDLSSISHCPPAVSALIAESGSSQSIAVAGTLGPFQLPIVSYFSACACLSDRVKYPTFFRTVSSDSFQAKALAALMRHFDWQWIGIIQSDNDYGQNGIHGFTEEVKKFGVCIAFVAKFLRTYSLEKTLNVVEIIKQSTVKVILAYVPEGDFYYLMTEIVKQNITGIQWLSSDAWITAARPSTPEMYQAFGGALGFVGRKMAIPTLKPFLTNISPYKDPSAFVRDFWEIMVTEQLRRVHFMNQFGDNVFFDENGNPPAYYDLINWQLTNGQVPTSLCSSVCPTGTRKAQIKGRPTCCFDCVPCDDGTITNSTAECSPCPQEYWSNDRKDTCIPKTTEFLTYQEPIGIAVTVVSLVGSGLSLATLMVYIRYRETPVIKASNSELSCFLLFSLLLCFLSPLTFIGRPTVWTCMLRHTAFGVTFALCISSVLGKTIVVVTAFKATFPGNNAATKFGPSQQRIIVCSCTVIQIIICVLWLRLNPPFPDMVFRYSNKKIVLECNPGSEAAFYAVLGYIGLLAITCLVLAFLARKLPDNFNEAKFITFSMLIFCAVWITFIPVYISSPGKFTVAAETFAILASALGLLICIFAPKCYIILIKPEKNTKRQVMGKIRT
ncbi:extracellular calcium-sensing receptor-like [Betta splendens]|uniref:Extracellular calcium-sensing receptor-like n=1 Tax=Betta splendens TaxID=158456 RepID=A0A9W2Y856_BETSP|nr:extracellular calcium-sensing receptor-like [Betta splendens]